MDTEKIKVGALRAVPSPSVTSLCFSVVSVFRFPRQRHVASRPGLPSAGHLLSLCISLYLHRGGHATSLGEMGQQPGG